MLNRLRRELRDRQTGPPDVWGALAALTHTTQLAGRDLGVGTFDWVRHAVAVFEVWGVIGDAGLAPDDVALALPMGELPGDSPHLRWAVMRLTGATAQALAEAAAGELDPGRRDACIRASGRLTEAAAHLRDTSVCAAAPHH